MIHQRINIRPVCSSYARLGVNKLSVESNSEDVYGFSKVIPHPEYDEKSVNRRADIGLLKVDRIIYFHSEYSRGNRIIR